MRLGKIMNFMCIFLRYQKCFGVFQTSNRTWSLSLLCLHVYILFGKMEMLNNYGWIWVNKQGFETDLCVLLPQTWWSRRKTHPFIIYPWDWKTNRQWQWAIVLSTVVLCLWPTTCLQHLTSTGNSPYREWQTAQKNSDSSLRQSACHHHLLNEGYVAILTACWVMFTTFKMVISSIVLLTLVITSNQLDTIVLSGLAISVSEKPVVENCSRFYFPQTEDAV